jgi:plasmid stability protein
MKARQRRATVYFDLRLHKALRLKAAETERSVSDLVNDAVKQALTEDAEDLEAFEQRAREPNLLFEHVVRDLRKRGYL